MKFEYEYEVRETKRKILEIPKKYEFRFVKDDDDWTDKEWDLNDEYFEWVDEQLKCYDDCYDIVREIK
jgi:hypothetical protein